MSVSTTHNRVSYVGDGVADIFPITMPFQDKTHIKVLKNGVLQVSTTNYDIYFDQEIAQPGNPSAWGPLGTVDFVVVPLLNDEIVIYRDAPAIQELVSQGANTRITSTVLEKTFDRIYEVIQRLFDLFKFVPKFPDSYNITAFNTEMPVPVPGGVLIINATNDGYEFKTATELVSAGSLGGGVPPGGATGDFLEKLSATDGDADWKSATYSGISRFGAWNTVGLKATVDKLVNILYTAPSISLSGSSNSLREKGASVSGITLSAGITKQSDPIATVRFYQGATLLDTQTSGGAIPGGGTSSYVYAPAFTDNISFSAQVDDNGATGGPSTVTSGTSYSFVYPYYYGAGAAGLGAAVSGLTKAVIASTASKSQALSPSGTNKMYFAYPSSYGALTSILDGSLFETFGDWTRSTVNITGLDASSVSYYVYEFNNVALAGTYTYTFKR